MKLNNSPIDKFTYHGREFLVKRDDLLDEKLNGNKARKLAYYLENDLPEIDTLISYGGTQSNMLLALSELAKLKNWRFDYYCYTPSKSAIDSRDGNLAKTLENGTNLIYVENNNLDYYISQLKTSNNQLLIHQGGRQIESRYGIAKLAQEINEYCTKQDIPQLAIFIPSGTGTTAYYLQQELPKHKVYTTNCVGSANYLLQQWQSLDGNHNKHLPTILGNTQFRFAKPNLELFKVINDINKVSNILFDLVYDPVAWNVLLNNLDKIDLPIMYIHCGGLTGNTTMMNRYRYLFPEYFAKI